MGFNTTLVLMNDALYNIKNDPEFGVRLADAVNENYGERGYKDVAAQGFVNAVTVIETHHADRLMPVLVGGNHGFVVGASLPWNTKAEEMDFSLLKVLAERLGYRISKKPVKK